VIEAIAEPDELERLGGIHRVVGDLGDERDVLARRQARDQVVELEHEPDVVAAVHRQLVGIGVGQILAAIGDLARGADVEAAEDVEQRRLAAAGRAEQHDELTLGQRDIDAAERRDLDFAHLVALGQCMALDDRGHGITAGDLAGVAYARRCMVCAEPGARPSDAARAPFRASGARASPWRATFACRTSCSAAGPPRGDCGHDLAAGPIMSSTGLVLAGASALGAYEVGVLDYVVDRVARDVRVAMPDVVTGTSAGAINAMALAAFADKPSRGTHLLIAAWEELRIDRVVRPSSIELLSMLLDVTGAPRGIRRALEAMPSAAGCSTRRRSRGSSRGSRSTGSRTTSRPAGCVASRCRRPGSRRGRP